MWTCAGVLAVATCALAITRDQFYQHGHGLDQRLPRGDQVASPEVPLNVPIVFFGEVYESIYVNNFGVVSFRAEIPTFINTEFPLPYPSIAAFYTNVDTTESGAVYYRETNETYVLRKAEESIQNHFHDYQDFKPASVFITTWVDVTYNSPTDRNRKNSFQLAIISDGNETFVELLYPEREIQWIQKETPANSLPDAKAQAGFIAEDGRVFTLRGSGSHQIRNIVTWSNVHEPGKYVFRVGKIPYEGTIAVPDLYDQTEAEVEEESKTCAQSGPSVCHIQARCVDYQQGICCKCLEGYYGNGKSCIKIDVPLRVHGKVNGILNNINIDNVDIQAYVVVAEGRSYTALSLVPPNLGSSLQMLNVLGGVVGWLFAKPSGTAKNGYQLTGSLFNHTADVYFPRTQDRVMINQEFLGHDVFDQISLDSDIRGTIPLIPLGSKLELTEYEEHFSFIENGVIRSESTRAFVNKVTGEKYEQIVTQTFTYNPCRFAPVSEEDTAPLTLKTSKNYLGYETRDNIVRYGSSNKISQLGQEDPCVEGKKTCGPHSSCLVDGNSFTCVCQTGFTNIYQNEQTICIDIDECAAGTHNCDNNADCYNHEGGFQCRCRPGYEGNGVNCRSLSQCSRDTCDPNAQCVENPGGEAICSCNAGYSGDGRRCWPDYSYICDQCSPYASCVFSESTHNYKCECLAEYKGNGYSCIEDLPAPSSSDSEAVTVQPTTPDPYVPNPSASYPGPPQYPYEPQSSYDSQYGYNPQSLQNSGGSNDRPTPYVPPPTQYSPTPLYSPSNVYYPESSTLSVPVAYTEPTTIEAEYNDSIVLPHCDSYGCRCPPGYSSYKDERNNDLCRVDSYSEPNPSSELNDTLISCYTDSECPPNAICTYVAPDAFSEPSDQLGHCVCPEGYEGDAYECIERTGVECSCGPNAHCTDTAASDVMCVCDSGYHGDGYSCRPSFSCNSNSDCEYNAECRLDSGNNYVCQCVEGYVKDENDACIPDGQLCNGAVCVEHASCLYDPNEQVSYCQCDHGYEGDAIVQCVPQGHTCDIANDCSSDALCAPYGNSYQCICKEGFTGDGYTCTPEWNCRTNPYMCDSHASCLKRNGGFQCECNTGYNGNGSYCALNPRKAGNFLVASDGASVYRVPFKSSPWEFATPFNSAAYQTAVGVDVDCLTGRIYWGDVIGNSIKRAAYDGSAFEEFLSIDVKAPEGISVDWAGRNVFWTDSRQFTIEVANVDTRVRKVLFKRDGITNPRGIAVHPQRGKIFWSDWNRNGPKIEWANMDGSQRGMFLDASDVLLPNSLAIDWARDRLCFADAGLHAIKCVHIDTLERETIAANCLHPFGLAINGDKFYWSDWKTLKIETIDAETKQKGQVPVSTASRRLYGVTVAPDSCPVLSNVCQYRNGNCPATQLCLPNGNGGRTCVAGDEQPVND